MMEHGYYILFGGNYALICDDSSLDNVVAKVAMARNRCFPLSMESICSMGMKAAVQEDPWIWHRRLGYLNFASMKKMQQTQMVLGLPDFSEKEGVCEGCVYGKSHREPFENEKPWRAKNPLEFIHMDVCGLMQNESFGGNKYFITFIDDYSRMCWVYFLINKSSVISVFKKFKAFVELQSGFNLKKLRSDRGGDTSHEFLEYCSDLGMERQLTIAYSPQQNGITERRNRTICEMARSMMTEKKIPVKFWAEAVGTTVYLQNRCYTTSVTDKTPFEAFTRRKPGVKHLRVFGSICYSHIPSNLKQKFDDKASKGIFMSYGSCEKGYRIYNLQIEKIILSRNVVFDENKSWNWESKQDETVHVPLIFENGSSEITEIEETSHETHSIASPNLNQLISDDEHVSESNGSGTSQGSTPSNTPVKLKSLEDIYARCHMTIIEPETYYEAIEDKAWKEAMDAEIETIEKNGTWELVERPTDKPVIGVKWVFKTKLNLDGTVQKHKARLVAKGYAQKPGIDYNETFAPVARLDTIRTLIALAAQKGWKLFQLDVKSAFLNGVLEEEVYTEQPGGFEVKTASHKVYKLKKALYGLKQAPRAWYSEIDTYLTSCNFKRSTSEATLYTRTDEEGKLIIASTYVDDIVYPGNNNALLSEFKRHMMQKYEMTDLGLLHHFLGMGVLQTVKWGVYSSKQAGSEDDSRSTSGYAFSFGSGVFSWASVKQNTVALSTAEAEYVSAAEATAQAIWLRFVLDNFGEMQPDATPLFCDNMSAISMVKNPVFHQKTRHIN
ncbi:hypothetical protein L3X38_027197 [Prunus dulcis]|uniref:Integrase catalytic domain-containing protein n=1 Tax=Prunus dulcis TaxID=3755 RepID=A0AAD4Z024_PRUDU|nr:hypothetical protein L3X38_027197 [Prunus dulcis]